MGYAGIISRDLIDKGMGEWNVFGWSPILPDIRYSDAERRAVQELGRSGIEGLSNIEKIMFYKEVKNEEFRFGWNKLIFKWRYVIEKRLNILLSLKRRLKFQGSRLSVDASISEIERAHVNVMTLLSLEPDIPYQAQKPDDSDNDFEAVFCRELYERLWMVRMKNTEINQLDRDEIDQDLELLRALGEGSSRNRDLQEGNVRV